MAVAEEGEGGEEEESEESGGALVFGIGLRTRRSPQSNDELPSPGGQEQVQDQEDASVDATSQAAELMAEPPENVRNEPNIDPGVPA